MLTTPLRTTHWRLLRPWKKLWIDAQFLLINKLLIWHCLGSTCTQKNSLTGVFLLKNLGGKPPEPCPPGPLPGSGPDRLKPAGPKADQGRSGRPDGGADAPRPTGHTFRPPAHNPSYFVFQTIQMVIWLFYFSPSLVKSSKFM